MQEYTVKINDFGDKWWYQNGKPHRLDGPAIECCDGTKYWYQNGKLHRLDGPAVEYANGYKSWFQNGKLNRIDGPAIERANGYKMWYLNGEPVMEQAVMKKDCSGKIVKIDGIKYKLVSI